MKLFAKSIGLIAVVTMGALFISSKSASAAIALNPDPGPGGMPGYIRNYMESADGAPQSPSIVYWASAAGDPAATSVNVIAGTQTINLDSHLAGVVGWSPSSTTRTDMNVVGATPGVANAVGDVNTIIFNPNQNVPGTYRHAASGFQYTNPTPFTTTTDIYLSLFVKTVNEFRRSNGTYYYGCVGENVAASGPSGSECSIDEVVFTIRVNVVNIRSYIDEASCARISGWAYDLTRPNTSIGIHVYVGGPAGSGAPGYALSTDVYRPDVNAYFGITGNHGFNFTSFGGKSIIDIAHDSPVTFYIYALGQYENPLIAAPTIGPCGQPIRGNFDGIGRISGDCQNIQGWAFDGDFPSKSVTIDVWVDGTAVPYANYLADAARSDVNTAYGITGNHGFVIPVPLRYKDNLPHSLDIWVHGLDTSGNPDGRNARVAGAPTNFTCPQPDPTPTCGSMIYVPSPEPNQPFDLRATAGSLANVLTNTNFRIDVSGAPIFGPGQFGTGTIPAGSNTSNVITQSISGKPIGNYTLNYTVTFLLASGNKTANCTTSVIVAAKPFFVVRNGDIASGFSDGAASCVNGWAGSNNASKLTSWSNGATGAGTNLATLALKMIDGVASAQAPSAKSPPSGLSFANASGYGGSYNATVECPADYYSKATSPTVTGTIAGTTTTVPKIDSHTNLATPTNLTLAGGSLGAGEKSALYVNGNVWITNNIILTSGGTLGTLSNFYLVVKGNIYIAPSVTQLDGVYVAQGSDAAGTGRIYTCSNGFSPPTGAMLNNECKTNALVVNGAFIADKVNMYRSTGTLFQNSPAETFNYTPNVWLAPPASIAPLFNGNGTTPSNGSYDAITTLPPVL